MFTLTSDITIGNFRCGGVSAVNIKRSLHSCIDTARIELPSMARVLSAGGNTNIYNANVGKLLKPGDNVMINLGYDGDVNLEFRGFVKEIGYDIPLVVECEGYSYQLRNKTIDKSWSKAKLKTILQDILQGTDIKLDIDEGSDIELTNIQGGNKTALELLGIVLDATNKAMDAWFVDPDVLKVGFIYLPDGDELKNSLKGAKVKYRIGYNALQNNGLKEKAPVDVKVIVNNSETKRKRNQDKVLADKVLRFVLNRISEKDLKKIQDILQFKQSYKGYEGKLTGFLRPLCFPGDTAFITDKRFTDRDGDYLVESVEVIYGTGGARRIVEIGPKLSTK